jgi:hypothetical protein
MAGLKIATTVEISETEPLSFSCFSRLARQFSPSDIVVTFTTHSKGHSDRQIGWPFLVMQAKNTPQQKVAVGLRLGGCA